MSVDRAGPGLVLDPPTSPVCVSSWVAVSG